MSDRITSITYRRLFSFGEFQNETIGCDILLDGTNDPAVALDEARRWAEEQHAIFQEQRGTRAVIEDLAQRQRELEYGTRRMKEQAEEYKRRAIQCAAFLIHSGLHPVRPPSWLSDTEIGEELRNIITQRDYYAERPQLSEPVPVEEIAKQEVPF